VPYCWFFDGAEGVGSDFCFTSIVRADTKQLVAHIRDNKREQREHAKVAARVIKEYNNGLGGWFRDHEADFATVMEAEGVTRVYSHHEEPTQAQRINRTPPTSRRGMPGHHRQRMIVVARLANYFERHEGAIPSGVIVGEAKRFIKTLKMPDGEAGPGAHDDGLFSFGGCLLMCEQPGAQTIRETSGASNVRGYTPTAKQRANVRGY
jgi:hypothetical protein